jgi:hypothetical protein
LRVVARASRDDRRNHDEEPDCETNSEQDRAASSHRVVSAHWQTPFTQVALEPQYLLQEPQLLRSLIVSTHEDPHAVRLCAHTMVQVPETHCFPCGQTMWQPPQLPLSLNVLAQ